MSSPISPALADYRDALLTAATEVAENSLFALTDVCDEAAFAAAADPSLGGGDEWLRAIVGFDGPITGAVDVTLPAPLARRLAASFSGTESDEAVSATDLIDFAGELANMVCGTWLTRACRHETFTLAPPRVDRAALAPAQDTGADCFYLSIDEAPIRLQLRSRDVDSSDRDSRHGD